MYKLFMDKTMAQFSVEWASEPIGQDKAEKVA